MDKYHVSILDTDLYKLTMQQAICKLYPKIKVRYSFINRDKREFPEGFDKRLREIIDSFQALNLKHDEKDFLLTTCYYLNPQYIDFLNGYKYDPSEVQIRQNGPNLFVDVEGYWYRTVLWEVPLMATISELYFEMTGQAAVNSEHREILNRDKAKSLANLGVFYSEFGTRRRYSFENQDQVVFNFKLYGNNHILGTSNIYLAMLNSLIPMGTVAHEWYQAHAAMFGFLQANMAASEAWVEAYQGDLGIALPDTFTTDMFYKYGFNTKYAKLFDGVRQDSGNPLIFLQKTVDHYKKLRIAPKLKICLFSDNLKSVEQIKEIHEACIALPENDRIVDRYGIGTWLSNDVGVKPLNIVIKLTALNNNDKWIPTIKLSDSPTKHTGDPNTVDLCLRTFGI